MNKRLELLQAPPGVKELVAECEVTGQRTIFLRNERPVAILISHDEYLALRETIDIGGDPALRAEIEQSEEEVKRNALVLPEDLFD